MNQNDGFDDVIARLRSLYRAEVARAESASPTVRPRLRTSFQPSLTLVAVAAVALAVVFIIRDVRLNQSGPSAPAGVQGQVVHSPANGLSTRPTLSPAAPASNMATGVASDAPAATNPSSTASHSATGSDYAWPNDIEGEPVLTGIGAQQRAGDGDDSPFLVGGWIAYVSGECYADCFSGFVLRFDAPGTPSEQVIGLRVHGPLDLPGNRAVVLQVRRDTSSPTCTPGPDCLESVAVDRTVWTETTP